MEEICGKIIDQLVISEQNPAEEGNAIANYPLTKSYQVMLEKDIEPMSDYIKSLKQIQFEKILRHEEGRNDDNKIDMEL